ncbi:LAQU0S11e01574g1_1 [Lachancea quebecensis]|uniref:LAQU0S11e01574g1_1 n=1 Tax=Lachancea quebecensis TaxID=1654605 RepID=A0A0P1KUX5_9SACH|nr:LAQU0S11e01574g1_1 [Lachancea quebecensis]
MAHLRIAVQGCAHGELVNIYNYVTRQYASEMPDLLIVLGDFQSLRDDNDMDSIAVPDKYKKLGDFPKYFSGELEAPLLTLFIGGNHENMRGLAELPQGGFVAKNIYYMGYSGSVMIQGVRISGLSGIYKSHDFERPRATLSQINTEGWERHVRNMYHVRKADVLPLFMLTQTDIMLSHDWPNGIAHHGDLKKLLKQKPFFKRDIFNNDLGSPVNWQLLRKLTPHWWLSAHLHVKFEAYVAVNKRARNENARNTDPNEIDLGLDDNNEDDDSAGTSKKTNFLALDKCGRNRKHMEIITVEADADHPTFHSDGIRIYLDPEFVANQQFLEKNPPKSKLEHISFESLRERRGELGDIDWESYRLEYA